MKSLLLLLLFCSAPNLTFQDPITRVEIIELNSYYSIETGKHMGDQWIFWEFDGPYMKVVDWKLPSTCSKIHPQKDGTFVMYHYSRKGYMVGNLKSFKIIGQQYRRTYTLYDPERKNQKIFSSDLRRLVSPGKPQER